MRPSHRRHLSRFPVTLARQYIQYMGSCIDASQRTSATFRSSTFSLYVNAMATSTCRAALGFVAVVRICSLLLLWLAAPTATAQAQAFPGNVPACGVSEAPWIPAHDMPDPHRLSHTLTRVPAAQMPPRSHPWIWLLPGRYGLSMLELGLAGQDQRLSCRQLHDAGASRYVNFTNAEQRPPRAPFCSKFECVNIYKDAADMSRVNAATCGLSDESQSTRVIIAVTFFFVGTSVFVMLRTWSKLLTRTLYAEDHIITLAVTLALAPFVCTVYSK